MGTPQNKGIPCRTVYKSTVFQLGLTSVLVEQSFSLKMVAADAQLQSLHFLPTVPCFLTIVWMRAESNTSLPTLSALPLCLILAFESHSSSSMSRFRSSCTNSGLPFVPAPSSRMMPAPSMPFQAWFHKLVPWR